MQICKGGFMIDIKDIYIDFDEVIFSTEDLLFERYKKLKAKGIKVDKLNYLQTFDWEDLIERSSSIRDSIDVLRELKEASILTKVHSMENEAVAKIKKLRSLGIRNDVIICPFAFKKTDIVDPRGKVLVDDTVHNLDDWYQAGGIPIFFNKNNEDIDGWGKTNTKYQKIKSLRQLENIKF